MFDKLNLTASKTRTPNTIAIPQLSAFVASVTHHGYRLSYTALARAAKALGEDSSNQKEPQRGGFLAKQLAPSLQPSVCKRGGGYHEKVVETFARNGVVLPEDLRSRPVIKREDVGQALAIWQEATAKKAAEANTESAS